MKFLQNAIWLIAFALAFAAMKFALQWFHNTQPGLDGATRSSFIKSAVATCVQTQSADPANQEFDPVVVKQYCTCFADKMADQLSYNEVKSMALEQQISEAVKPRADVASNTCAEELASSLIPGSDQTKPSAEHP